MTDTWYTKTLNQNEIENLYDRVFLVKGETHQAIVAMEELSELQKEFAKWIRHDCDVPENIFTEIADVEIMLEQFKRYFNCYDIVAYEKQAKLNRLQHRLDKHQEEL